jgi:Ca2+-dependent lipid-binding protein
MKRTLNPVWEEVVHVSLDQGTCNNNGVNDLAGAMLYLTVMDDDYSIDNEVVGAVALNLADLCSNNMSTPGPFAVQRTEIKRPILRNGQEFGMLECTISSAYCSAKEDKAFVNSAKRVQKIKARMGPFQQAIRKVRSF